MPTKQYTAKPVMALASAFSASHNVEEHPRHWTPNPQGTLTQQTHYAQTVEIRPNEIDWDIALKLGLRSQLQAQLQACRAPIDAAIIANVLFANAAHCADTGNGHGFSVSLMDLIKQVGWYTDESLARRNAIAQMATWVCSIGACYVDVGRWEEAKVSRRTTKRGKPSPKIEKHLTQLMSVSVTLYEGGLDGVVYIAPSPWLFAIENRPAWYNQYLPTLDEVMRLPSSGKASGAWARCIALNLRWLWRRYCKQPSTAIIESCGVPQLQYRPFSRKELLSMPYSVSSPTIEALSHEPRLTKKYWQRAIDILVQTGVIGHIECDRESEAVNEREGWLDAWLNATFAVTPGPAIHAALLDIRTAGESADGDLLNED